MTEHTKSSGDRVVIQRPALHPLFWRTRGWRTSHVLALLCVTATPVLGATSARAQEAAGTAPQSAQSAQSAAPSPPPAVTPTVSAAATAAAPPTAQAPRTQPDVRSDDDLQDQERDATEGSGAFIVGSGFFDLSSLNNRLARAGYEKLDSTLPVIGGEGHAVFESGFVIGGRGAAILGTSADGPANQRAHFGGGFGMLDVGFALVQTQRVLLTLVGGLGGYGLSLEINDEQSARFDDVLRAPARGASLSRGGLLVAMTLGIDGRVPIGRSEHGRRGFFTLGARLGVLYGLPTGSWSLPEDARASAGPQGALTGVYAALVIGFGGGTRWGEAKPAAGDATHKH